MIYIYIYIHIYIYFMVTHFIMGILILSNINPYECFTVCAYSEYVEKLDTTDLLAGLPWHAETRGSRHSSCGQQRLLHLRTKKKCMDDTKMFSSEIIGMQGWIFCYLRLLNRVPLLRRNESCISGRDQLFKPRIMISLIFLVEKDDYHQRKTLLRHIICVIVLQATE